MSDINKKEFVKHLEKLLGENAILKERNKELMFRIETIKNISEQMADVSLDYLANNATKTDIEGHADRVYYLIDDPNSIEKYIKNNVI